MQQAVHEVAVLYLRNRNINKLERVHKTSKDFLARFLIDVVIADNNAQHLLLPVVVLLSNCFFYDALNILEEILFLRARLDQRHRKNDYYFKRVIPRDIYLGTDVRGALALVVDATATLLAEVLLAGRTKSRRASLLALLAVEVKRLVVRWE